MVPGLIFRAIPSFRPCKPPLAFRLLLIGYRMSSTATTAATAAITATTAANFAAGLLLPLPPPALPALPALPPHLTRAMAALSLLTACRVPVLRPGCTTNPARPANLEAELGQITGQVCASRCTHYAGRSGVWTACIVIARFFSRSCANCHYSSEGARCSFCK